MLCVAAAGVTGRPPGPSERAYDTETGIPATEARGRAGAEIVPAPSGQASEVETQPIKGTPFMKRREAILGAMAVFSATQASGLTTRTVQTATVPPPPTMPVGTDPELVERIQRSYNWDMLSMANAVESAIQVHRVAPEWITSGQMPEELRKAILRETDQEPFAAECGNLKPLRPGYVAKLVDQARTNLLEFRAEEQRRAEVKAAVDAEQAAREATLDAKDAEREHRDAVKIITQDELKLALLLQAAPEKARKSLEERMVDGWTVEPGPLSVGPGPAFAILGAETECA